MRENFEPSLKHVLVHEGGWADHPKDPGGATMKGVTLATFRRFYGAERTKDDLRAISDAQLGAIYRDGYWDRTRCDDLAGGVDYVVFDAAVNSGPGRAVRWLRLAARVAPGPGVDDALIAAAAARGAATMIEAMLDARMAFLRGLPTFATFGRGWTRRVVEARAIALEMAGETSSAEPVAAPDVTFEVVRRGSKGEWVAKLQKALGVEADGDFGDGTEAALRTFQAANLLQVDGVAGRNTWRALGLAG